MFHDLRDRILEFIDHAILNYHNPKFYVLGCNCLWCQADKKEAKHKEKARAEFFQYHMAHRPICWECYRVAPTYTSRADGSLYMNCCGTYYEDITQIKGANS